MICDARAPETMREAWAPAFERTSNDGAGALLRVADALAATWDRKNGGRDAQDWPGRDADALECSAEAAGAIAVAEKSPSGSRFRRRETTWEAPRDAFLDSSTEKHRATVKEKTWATSCRCMNLPC